ncbi:MAG: glutaredoxin domain-containing protein [Planctomycetota bacterium]
MWTKDDIQKAVSDNKILIFGKGTKDQPMCGFTHRAIAVATQLGKPFEVINIFDDESIRPALVSFSDWPTTPQFFVGGEFIGGSDTALEMFESGELQQKVDQVFAS